MTADAGTSADAAAVPSGAPLAGVKRASVVGIITGSGLSKSSMFRNLKITVIDTEFGQVLVRVGELNGVKLVLVQRHAADPHREYCQPRKINFKAIAMAMKQLNCEFVVGTYSVGSLKKEIPIGSVVVPHDFFNPSDMMHISDGYDAHYVPVISSELRAQILNVITQRCGIQPISNGVYMQTSGPRFETAAEIRFLSLAGDIVGMTGAHEAELLNELKIPFAMLAMVDNFCNGIGLPLTLEEFHAGQKLNLVVMETCVMHLLAYFTGAESIDIESPSTADTIIYAKYIVPVEPVGTVLQDHALVIRGGKIIDILSRLEAEATYSAPVVRHLMNHVLLPGLINGHTHSPMTNLRGLSDDKTLIEWLSKHIWPAEAHFVAPDFVQHGTRLAAAEMIRSGTTCFSDMYFFPEDSATVLEEVGLRGVLGRIVVEFPSSWAANPDEYFARGKEVQNRFQKSDLVTFSVAPHAPYTVSDKNLARVAAVSAEEQIPIHTHLHETQSECCDSEKLDISSLSCHKSDQKCRPLQNFHRLGLLSERFVGAHMTQLTAEEIKILASTKANVVHCPSSNMKLASGFCPVSDLLKAGVNVCIGTDGTASNNTLDMFAEMKLAALLAKGVSNDPTSVPAEVALRMATINGAKALGLGNKVGSLEIGKQADVIAVDLESVELMPLYCVISHLVYSTTRDKVSHSWVSGRLLMEDRKLTTIDLKALVVETREWEERVRKHHDI